MSDKRNSMSGPTGSIGSPKGSPNRHSHCSKAKAKEQASVAKKTANKRRKSSTGKEALTDSTMGRESRSRNTERPENAHSHVSSTSVSVKTTTTRSKQPPTRKVSGKSLSIKVKDGTEIHKHKNKSGDNLVTEETGYNYKGSDNGKPDVQQKESENGYDPESALLSADGQTQRQRMMQSQQGHTVFSDNGLGIKASDIQTKSKSVARDQESGTLGDSSDIEVIAEDKDSSDSIEILDSGGANEKTPTAAKGKPCNLPANVPVAGNHDERTQHSMTKPYLQSERSIKAVDDPFDVGDDDTEPLLDVDPETPCNTRVIEVVAEVYQGGKYISPSTESHLCHTKEDSHGATEEPGLNLEEHMHDMANGTIPRPDSLSLPKPLQFYERQKQLNSQDSDASSRSDFTDLSRDYSSTDELIQAVSHTPLQAQGTVVQEGDMVAFVAEGLQEMIKMSSPLARKDSSSNGTNSWVGSHTPSAHSVNSMSSSASGWSSSASGWSAISSSNMSRSPSLLTQSPEDIPPIDPRALQDLELNAKRVADSLDLMMGNLKTSLHKMSAMTGNCLHSYQDAIDRTCDSVDASIKSMYALMAKCEELSKTMAPVYTLAEQVKEIKRLLDLFEVQLSKEEAT